MSNYFKDGYLPQPKVEYNRSQRHYRLVDKNGKIFAKGSFKSLDDAKAWALPFGTNYKLEFVSAGNGWRAVVWKDFQVRDKEY